MSQHNPKSTPRRGNTFSLANDKLAAPPESIEGRSDDSAAASVESPPTESQEMRLMRRIALACASFLGVLIAYDAVSLIIELWQLHWTAGSGALLLLTLLLAQIGLGLRRWIRGGRGAEQITALQEQAVEIRASRGHQLMPELIRNLQHYYQGTPHSARLNAAILSMPDYLDDSERLVHLEQHFVEPLDDKVQSIIQKYSLQTGLAVAGSPFPSLDVVLTLWRNLIMVNEIASSYGVTPTLKNRVVIVFRVMRNLALTGLSEASIDLLSDLSPISMTKLGARAAQGMGAAVATARIGIAAASFCRPIARAKSDQSGLVRKLVEAVLLLIGKRLHPSVKN